MEMPWGGWRREHPTCAGMVDLGLLDDGSSRRRRPSMQIIYRFLSFIRGGLFFVEGGHPQCF
jgi:hypothetical protein